MAIHIRRREFIVALGGAATAWPIAARAQRGLPVIGFLQSTEPDEAAQRLASFRRGLGEMGYERGSHCCTGQHAGGARCESLNHNRCAMSWLCSSQGRCVRYFTQGIASS
jgi:hypothetical protein